MPEPDDDFDALDRLDADAEDYLSPEEREARRKQFQDVVDRLRQQRAEALARGEAPPTPATMDDDDELDADWDEEHEGLLDRDDSPIDTDDTDDEDY